MFISVIVPTMNRLNDLITFIESLKKQTCLPEEVIIIDQSDNDLTEKYIHSYKRKKRDFIIKYSMLGDKSLTRAKNYGINMINKKADLIAFFDDDIILSEDFFEVILNFFKNDRKKEYAVATGMILYDNRRKSVFFYIIRILSWFFFLPYTGNGKFRINGQPTFYDRFASHQYDVEAISGGVSVFRKEIFNTFRFDGNMRSYCYMEDDDSGYRISREHKNIFLPQANVIHNISADNRLKISNLSSQLIQNYIYLFNKNIPKNPVTIFSFILSIIGYFIMAFFNKDPLVGLKKVKGYFAGIIKAMSGKYDSLYPDWKENIDKYRGC